MCMFEWYRWRLMVRLGMPPPLFASLFVHLKLLKPNESWPPSRRDTSLNQAAHRGGCQTTRPQAWRHAPFPPRPSLRFLCTSNRSSPARTGRLSAGTPTSIRPPTVEGAKQPARRLGAAPPLLPVPRLLFSGGFSLLPIFHAFDPPYHASRKARSCKSKPQTRAGAAGHGMRCKQGASAMTLRENVFD